MLHIVAAVDIVRKWTSQYYNILLMTCLCGKPLLLSMPLEHKVCVAALVYFGKKKQEHLRKIKQYKMSLRKWTNLRYFWHRLD
jgi:hypothetical protein